MSEDMQCCDTPDITRYSCAEEGDEVSCASCGFVWLEQLGTLEAAVAEWRGLPAPPQEAIELESEAAPWEVRR